MFAGNDSVGIAAYLSSRVTVERCVFDGNREDGGTPRIDASVLPGGY